MAKRDDNKSKKMDAFKKMYIRNWIICIVSLLLIIVLYVFGDIFEGDNKTSSEAFIMISISDFA